MLHQRFMSENIKNGVFLVLLHFFLFPGYFNKFRHVRFLFAVDGSNSSDHHFRLFRLIVRHKPAKALRNYTVKKTFNSYFRKSIQEPLQQVPKTYFLPRSPLFYYFLYLMNVWKMFNPSTIQPKILYNWCSLRKPQWNNSKGSTSLVKQLENSSQNSK